jgi:hypothetical protein
MVQPAAEAGDLADERARQVGALRGRREEHRLDRSDVPVVLGHAQLELEVAGAAQTLHDRGDPQRRAQVDEQPVERDHVDAGATPVRECVDLGAQERDPLVRAEHRTLRRVPDDGDDEPREQPCSTLDDVEMPVGDGVEAARIDRRSAHGPSSSAPPCTARCSVVEP